MEILLTAADAFAQDRQRRRRHAIHCNQTHEKWIEEIREGRLRCRHGRDRLLV
jgi:hypothetical protein